MIFNAWKKCELRLFSVDGAERGVLRERKWWVLVMTCSWLWGIGEENGGSGIWRVWMGGDDREFGQGEMCKIG